VVCAETGSRYHDLGFKYVLSEGRLPPSNRPVGIQYRVRLVPVADPDSSPLPAGDASRQKTQNQLRVYAGSSVSQSPYTSSQPVNETDFISATVLSALTLYYRVMTLRTVDFTYIFIPGWICSTFELNLGVICVCLPCFPALLKTKRMQHLLSSHPWLAWLSSSSSHSHIRSKDMSMYVDITRLDAGDTSASGIVMERTFELREDGGTHRPGEQV
jgi:hypothetical protein